MPDGYVVDANCYVRALRERAELEALLDFLRRLQTRVRLHAVVVMELRAGALTAAQRQALDALVDAHARRAGRVSPSSAAFDEAGRVLADLAARERYPVAAAPASFRYDVLLAASCREAGLTLVTRNHAAFARIGRHLRGFHAVAPWPAG